MASASMRSRVFPWTWSVANLWRWWGAAAAENPHLLNLAGAMDFPTSGKVLLDGVSTSSLQDSGLTQLRRERVGFVFQSFQLLQTLTVFENVELPLLLVGKSKPREAARERLPGWS